MFGKKNNDDFELNPYNLNFRWNRNIKKLLARCNLSQLYYVSCDIYGRNAVLWDYKDVYCFYSSIKDIRPYFIISSTQKKYIVNIDDIFYTIILSDNGRKITFTQNKNPSYTTAFEIATFLQKKADIKTVLESGLLLKIVNADKKISKIKVNF